MQKTQASVFPCLAGRWRRLTTTLLPHGALLTVVLAMQTCAVGAAGYSCRKGTCRLRRPEHPLHTACCAACVCLAATRASTAQVVSARAVSPVWRGRRLSTPCLLALISAASAPQVGARGPPPPVLGSVLSVPPHSSAPAAVTSPASPVQQQRPRHPAPRTAPIALMK